MNFHRIILGSLCGLMLVACDKQTPDVPYRDLNKNGRQDVYEDPGQPLERRIDDLLSQMTVAEKAGLMFINRSIVNDDASLDYVPGSGPKRHDAIEAIDLASESRAEFSTADTRDVAPLKGSSKKIEVSGATLFVLDVEHCEVVN